MDLQKRYNRPETAGRMAGAASGFLAPLAAESRARAQLEFEDTVERKNWHYIPRDRQGLALKEMDASLREKAFRLIDIGVSESARSKVRTIISLEPILGSIEGPGRKNPRDSGLYHLSIFGNPEENATWGWRFEGHHISINYTIVDGTFVGPTPIFFGANPAEVRHGEKKGLRALKDEEELGRDLLGSLDPEQKRPAVISAEAPSDIVTRNVPHVTDEVGPQGLIGEHLTADQRDTLRALIRVYVDRLPEELAEAEWDRVESADLTRACFAWAGAENRNEGHYYRFLGPTFLAEYDNTQNDANHIHAVWRNLTNDFGSDILGDHYRQRH